MEKVLIVWLSLVALWILWQVVRLCQGGIAFVVNSARQTRAKRSAEHEAQARSSQARQRQDARASVELLYQLHQHALVERLDKHTVMDWIARYMNDDQPLQTVLDRHREITGLVLALTEKPVETAGPSADVIAARKQVEVVYEQHPAIHADCPVQRIQAEIRVRIPDGASPEEAWTGARDIIKELLDLVTEEEEQRQKRQTMPVNPPLTNV